MTKIVYRAEIDGLRAIAVLSVVLYHAGIGPSAGFAGVDVFFVISGYLITALLLKEWTTTGRIDLFGFYARRFFRIFPALIVVVASTVTASAYLLSPFGEQHRVLQSAAASLVFAANFFFKQPRVDISTATPICCLYCICGRSLSRNNFISSGRWH